MMIVMSGRELFEFKLGTNLNSSCKTDQLTITISKMPSLKIAFILTINIASSGNTTLKFKQKQNILWMLIYECYILYGASVIFSRILVENGLYW